VWRQTLTVASLTVVLYGTDYGPRLPYAYNAPGTN